jgi:hypothetical protein
MPGLSSTNVAKRSTLAARAMDASEALAAATVVAAAPCSPGTSFMSQGLGWGVRMWGSQGFEFGVYEV